MKTNDDKKHAGQALLEFLASLDNAKRRDYRKLRRLVRQALEHGNIDDARWFDGKTALHLAVMFWPPKAAQILLDAGANPESRDHDGRKTWQAVTRLYTWNQTIDDVGKAAELRHRQNRPQ